jgi:hypothetical protein
MERDTGLAILVPFARSRGEPIPSISASSGRARGARAPGFVACRLLDIFSKHSRASPTFIQQSRTLRDSNCCFDMRCEHRRIGWHWQVGKAAAAKKRRQANGTAAPVAALNPLVA